MDGIFDWEIGWLLGCWIMTIWWVNEIWCYVNSVVDRQAEWFALFCWQWSRQELPSHFCLPCIWGSIPDPPPPQKQYSRPWLREINQPRFVKASYFLAGWALGGWHRSPWDLMSVILHGAIVPWFPWWRRSKNFTKLIMNGCNTTRQSKSRSGWRWKSQ